MSAPPRFVSWLSGPLARGLSRFLLTGYLLVLAWTILFKGFKVLDIEAPQFRLSDLTFDQGRFNLVPGSSIMYYFTFQEKYTNGLFNVGGNILAFIPLGILLPLAASRFASIAMAGRAAFLLSACMELTQWLTATGTCEVDDIMLNVSGALMGFLILRSLLFHFRAGKGAFF